MKERELILTITIKDCKQQFFRSGGPGGQNQNKRETGVRIIHPPSGAVGEARDERSQEQNRKLAFERMAKSDKFQSWIKRVCGTEEVEVLPEFKVRTYNFSRNEVVDYRTGIKTSDLSGVLDGNLDMFSV
jgi:protein subunit release factor A